MNFNWCFIGTGKIAHKVAKELVTNPGHRIVSVYNRTKEKAESFALTYHAKVYDSAFEAINDPNVDAVYIATTNETHFEFAKLCLYNSVPVLCEKPITGNALELKKLIKLSEANDTFLKEAMWTWFNPVANKVKEWIKEERIGKARHRQSHACTEFPFGRSHRLDGWREAQTIDADRTRSQEGRA